MTGRNCQLTCPRLVRDTGISFEDVCKVAREQRVAWGAWDVAYAGEVVWKEPYSVDEVEGEEEQRQAGGTYQ